MKRSLFLLFILIIAPFFQSNAFCDKVFFKNGSFIEGEIVSQDEKNISIKRASGEISTIPVSFLKVALKKSELNYISPLNEYKSKKESIKPDDAEGFYRLGIFCKTNGIYNSAEEEFSKAKELDKNYEKDADNQMQDMGRAYSETLYKAAKFYYDNNDYEQAKQYLNKIISLNFNPDYVAKSNNLVSDIDKQLLQGISGQKNSLESLKKILSEGNIYIPKNVYEVEEIINFIKSLNKKMRYSFTADYLKKGEELSIALIKKHEGSKEMAEGCFNIADRLSRDNKTLNEKVKKSQYDNLIRWESNIFSSIKPLTFNLEIPDTDKKVKEIESFIYCLNQPSYGLLYLDMANKYKEGNSKKDLQTAINCYNIALMFSENPDITAQILSMIKEAKSKIIK